MQVFFLFLYLSNSCFIYLINFKVNPLFVKCFTLFLCTSSYFLFSGTLWATPSSHSACSHVWSPCSTPSPSTSLEPRRFTAMLAWSPADSSSMCFHLMRKVCEASSPPHLGLNSYINHAVSVWKWLLLVRTWSPLWSVIEGEGLGSCAAIKYVWIGAWGPHCEVCGWRWFKGTLQYSASEEHFSFFIWK